MRNFRSPPPLHQLEPFSPSASQPQPQPRSQSPSQSQSRSQSQSQSRSRSQSQSQSQSRSQSQSPSQSPSQSLSQSPSLSPSHSQSLSQPPSRSSSPSRSHSFAFQRLDCYRVARELAALVHAAGIADAELRDQATRAAKSCFLCLCEGLPNDRVAMRRKYFTESNNSLHETVGAVDLACAIGALGPERAAELQALADRLRRLLRGLLNPGGRAR